MPQAADTNALLQKLEDASQQHEVNIVIDLGLDRIIKWIGTYFILALAAIAKISDYIGPSLSCYPANRSAKVTTQFISFTSTYCWESPHSARASNFCLLSSVSNNLTLLSDPNKTIFFIQWLPYFMLLQAILFMIPWSYWHFRVGSRLIGHLKFMQLLLNDIFQELQILPRGYYSKPYDEHSKCFDGQRKYKSENEQNKKPRPSANENVSANGEANTKKTDKEREKEPLLKGSDVPSTSKSSSPMQESDDGLESVVTSQEGECNVNNSNSNNKACSSPDEKEEDEKSLYCSKMAQTLGKKITSVIVGEMTDRHFFSMLCFENFASMHHLPFILSAFKVCRGSKAKTNSPDPEHKPYVFYESLLYLWCDSKNLNHTFLVKTYMCKHISNAIIAILMLILLAIFGAVCVDIASSETFECQLPYEEMCALCTIRHRRDVFSMFCCDVILTFLVLVASLYNWRLVRASHNKATCHYFDHLKETCNVALAAARVAKATSS